MECLQSDITILTVYYVSDVKIKVSILECFTACTCLKIGKFVLVYFDNMSHFI